MPIRTTGRYECISVVGEHVNAFIPYPLPPTEPPLQLDAKLAEHVRNAQRALERLDLAGEVAPTPDWLIDAFVRKEAVLSSQIEGTQATLADLLDFESNGKAPNGVPDGDAEDAYNCLEANTYSRTELVDPKGLPLSMRLLCEAHRRLMRSARGRRKLPGEVRRSQNWIGGSRPGDASHVPPPAHALSDLLGEFERYIHANDALPPLVRAGLLHVQFETIHPYLDGNGRIGRLLISLLLEEWRVLKKPLLYLSLFFMRHRDDYYRRLRAVRTEGDWEGWLEFFLTGVATTADEAAAAARELTSHISADRERVLATEGVTITALRLFDRLPRHPIVSLVSVIKFVETTESAGRHAIELLVAAGVLVDTTGSECDQRFEYKSYIDRLNEGTELKGHGRRR